MDTNKRNEVKKKILKRYELYKLQNSRLKRILKDPFRTPIYFVMVFIAYIHPFKVNYKTFWGDKMSFFLPEGNAIYYYGFFEANLTNFFINHLKEKDIFFDVGAHVGYYTMLTSTLVEGNGEVHSFEPTPRTFSTLERNVQKKDNVTINNCAVLDSKEVIDFVDYGPKYSAFNSFKKRTGVEMKFLSNPEKIKVPAISLDKYCRDKQIYPNIIKIDAEGSEHLILQAMEEILADKKPLVTIEVAGEEEWQGNCEKSIKILEEKGYVGYEIDVNGLISRHTQKDKYSYDNLLFAHPDNMMGVEKLLKNKHGNN